jgi:hypothetical protein
MRNKPPTLLRGLARSVSAWRASPHLPVTPLPLGIASRPLYSHFFAALEYRVLVRRNQISEPFVKSITSAAHFDKLISSGRSLVHMHRSAEPAADGKKAKKQSDCQGNYITDLEEALAAMQVPGTYLMMFDSGALLAADVSNLKGFRDNTAKGLEMETNCTNRELAAFAVD